MDVVVVRIKHWEKRASRIARTRAPLLLQEGKRQAEAAQAVALPATAIAK
jgi:hypothetical protein